MARPGVGVGSSSSGGRAGYEKWGLEALRLCRSHKARELADRWRAELAAGRNPLDTREVERRSTQSGQTFREIALDLHAAKSPAWRNAKVRKQWMAPLERYAARLMPLPVDQIRTEDVLKMS